MTSSTNSIASDVVAFSTSIAPYAYQNTTVGVSTPIDGNVSFKGTLSDITTNASVILADGSVSTRTAESIPAFRAYLEVTGLATAPSRIIAFVGGDNPISTALQQQNVSNSTAKFIQNGRLFILRNGHTYDASGREVK